MDIAVDRVLQADAESDLDGMRRPTPLRIEEATSRGIRAAGQAP